MDIFTEISVIFGIALLVSTVMRLLKQPLIIGYILTGVIVGPTFLNILRSTDVIELFSKLGITALLFIVGLGLNPKVIQELGKVSLVTGVGQVLFTAFFGFFIARLLGYNTIESGYIAVALTFSSTIIILKLLSDKGDMHKLYGRISIGFLLVQDLIATILLVAISSVTSVGAGSNVAWELILILAKGAGILVILLAFSMFVLHKLGNFVSKSQEFLFIA
nr:cation:proton antiporter [Patescibacteria group bacterium]